jgi:flavin-dependent dehydrogenase
VAIGDAWCTTNPQGGRGVTLGLRSAAALADVVERVPRDDLGSALDAWGEAELEPWFHDHVEWDAALLQTWAGQPVHADGPIGIHVVAAAARERHPEWLPTLGAYFDMQVLPTALDPMRDQVRGMVRGGWQPPSPAGMSRGELAELIAGQLKAATPVSA